MDYPDENEEFELQYQDELDMLEELNVEENVEPASFANTQNNTTHSNAAQNENTSHGLFSTQLSQISYASEHLLDAVPSGVPVSRKLFGTPKRGFSTPIASKRGCNGLKPIEEVVDISGRECVTNRAEHELNAMDMRSKRRLEQDLFGDIDDLYYNETYSDPAAKKARTEEERDMEIIGKILEARKRHSEATHTYQSKDHVEQLDALLSYKRRNLSHITPNWPFLIIKRSDHDRIHVRFHSNAYEDKSLDELRVSPTTGSLLGEDKQKVWSMASEIVLKRLNSAHDGPMISHPSVPDVTDTEILWVEKYKPRKYIDLLSDESTNRSLLYWLKMWDKVVFGKEFKANHEEINVDKLNTFNKRTNKFESNGGWQKRRFRQALNTTVDNLGRPMQKIALLCGPPGLGKTTLAHTIARHAGYTVREINASDDRSPEAFKTALENGTQMTSMLNKNARPNCIILDEIDGAPKQSIEYLVKFVSDNIVTKSKAKDVKAKNNVLKRPIICICNDLYDPALRPLRQIAFIVSFPSLDSARLADRLFHIARSECIKTDYGALFALAEKSGNDVRSCISTMEFFKAHKKSLTLHDVLNNNMGQKDRHQGLFDIWRAVFGIKRPKKQLEHQKDDSSKSHITITDMSAGTRVQNVLVAVRSEGDYDRLIQGVYENYLHLKMPDPNMNGTTEALQWFCFSDHLQRQINQLQNYTVYPYLQYGFAIWHLLFASLAWPKINFPMRGYEYQQKANTQRSIFQCMHKGITTSCIGVGRGATLLYDTLPLLKRILSPAIRSMNVHLLSQKEQNDMRHVVEVMVDMGLKYIQVKSIESTNVYQIEPNIETLIHFEGYANITLNYFGRQLIAREVELELVRRATPKIVQESSAEKSKPLAKAAIKPIPNHLRTLEPKRLQNNVNLTTQKDVAIKDFFGRIQQKSVVTTNTLESKNDPIVKSPIWYRYKEGFNNAVRKDIYLNELL